MSQRIETILDLLSVVKAGTGSHATLDVIREQRSIANRRLAEKYDVTEQTVRDTYREQLKPEVDGVEAFDAHLHAWRTSGDGGLKAVLLKHADASDKERIEVFFALGHEERTSEHGSQIAPSNGVVQKQEESFSAEEADQDVFAPWEAERPSGVDHRTLIHGQIRRRRGQRRFRDDLRARYGNRCMVTGCEVLAVLEAAHIRTHAAADDNRPENGLLLRSDIHTLFDLNLLGIEPKELRVEWHPDIAREYEHLSTGTLRCAGSRPDEEALARRYGQFRERLRQPA